jgi:hypothetical protein
MNMEKWRSIDISNGLYEVSSEGRIKRLAGVDAKGRYRKEKILKTYDTGDGYHSVYLYINGERKILKVHRLVATAFIENLGNKKYVNHLNGIRDDNRFINLVWCTASENTKYSYDVLGRKSFFHDNHNLGRVGILNSNSKKIKCSTLDVDFDSISEAANVLGMTNGQIAMVCKGQRKSAHGLNFRY